jgi:hypothetical protein
MLEDADFSVLHFQLKPGDRLLIDSDGTLEATLLSGDYLDLSAFTTNYAKAPTWAISPAPPSLRPAGLYQLGRRNQTLICLLSAEAQQSLCANLRNSRWSVASPLQDGTVKRERITPSVDLGVANYWGQPSGLKWRY